MRKAGFKLVRGIGHSDGKYLTSVDGKNVKEYTLWYDMLLRCTEAFQNKYPTYKGTTCSEDFKVYSKFYEWCNRQIGFNSKEENGRNWHLDKDILVRGNKVYGEDSCVFLPAEVNTILVKSNSIRGKHPLGVCRDERRDSFIVQCKIGNRDKKYLGRFKTPEQAFQAYKTFKEAYINK